MEWLFALAALIGIAISGPHTKDRKKMDSSSLSKWPEKWGANIPTSDHIKAVEAAVKKFPRVPDKLLFALEKKESNCKDLRGGATAINNQNYKDSWFGYTDKKGIYHSPWKDRLISGSSKMWSSMFGPGDWRPYGAWQVNPYNIIPKYVPIGAPLSELLNPYKIAMAAANLLDILYEQDGSWFKALIHYNRHPGWREQVMKYYADLGGRLSDLGTPDA